MHSLLRRRLLTAAAVVASATVALVGCSSSSGSTAAANTKAGCTPAHTFTTIKSGVLTVSIPDIPPLAELKDNKADGLDVDLIQHIADLECLDIEWSTQTYASAIPAVQSGRADVVIGGYYRTAARAKIVSLSDPVYLDQMTLMSAEGYTTVPQIQSKRVGTVDGYLWVADMKKVFGDSLQVYQSNVQMMADIAAGRLDVGVDGSGPAIVDIAGTSLKAEPVEPYDQIASSAKPAQVNFPYSQSNPDLGKALNADIAAMHADGTITKALEKAGLPDSLEKVGDPWIIQ